MRAVLTIAFLALLGCGESKTTQPDADKGKADAEKGKADPAKGEEKTPAKGGPSDADLAKQLVGRWDGLQPLRNARGVVTVDSIVTLDDGGKMTFDGHLQGRKQIIGYGTWTVKSGHLTCVIESSNAPKDIPSGSARTVQVREIDDKEMLYVDPTDQRTYSAKRVTGAAPPPAKSGKKK